MRREIKWLVALFAVAMVVSCQSKFVHNVVKTHNSIEVEIDSIKISLEIIDEGIVHVTKSLVGYQGYTPPSLITVLEPQKERWGIKEYADRLVVECDDIEVVINERGEISYYNEKGRHLVSEIVDEMVLDPESRERAAVQPFTVGDEALYGLGQFQSGIMNWKHVPMTLYQFNQEAAVPFLISTNNYAILWNNCSVTDVNPAENEIEFTQDGEVNELAGYDKSNIDVEDVKNAKGSIDREANIRTTTFTPKESGLYTFYAQSDLSGRMRGDIKVIIDGDTIIDYATIWVPLSFSGKKELTGGKEYRVVYQNSGASIPGRLLYNTPSYNKTTFSSRSGATIDYYLLCGDSPEELIELNHDLTGHAPLMGKKSYGFWQCRERYHTQQELLENVKEMRKRRIPFDIVVQDWFYWPKGTKCPEWDRAKYPDPEAMASEVHENNLELMVSVWPTVTNDPLLEKYDLVESKLEGTNHLDFWSEKVAKGYYQMVSDSMFHIGVNSIWLDGSEPESRPKDDFMTKAGEFRYLANSYSLMVTKAMYEGKRKEFPSERVVNLTRSAFSGQQRYSAVTWSGDVQSTWKQLREQISAGLNFAMSGLPYWSHDIGGFFRDSKSINPIFDSQYTNTEYRELLSRWFQFGAFSPVFRIHGYVSETEIWRYGSDFEAMARKFIDLRYQLMPYIYSHAWKITKDGGVFITPLAYHWPKDKQCWSIDNQLLFGESIMAAFVTEYGQREMNVYLPKGEWFNFWSCEKIDGGREVTVDTPLDQIPLFVKAGSIVPFGPKLQYATEPSSEPIHIRIYPGNDAEYELYLDDNQSYDYEKGIYSIIDFDYNDRSKTLEIEHEKGNYINFKKNPMHFVIDLMGTSRSVDVEFKGKKLEIEL